MKNTSLMLAVLLLAGCGSAERASSGPPVRTSSGFPIRVSRADEATASNEPQPPPVVLTPIEHPDVSSDVVCLAEIPKVTLAPVPMAAPGAEHIEALISALAAIESPDFGLSPTISGHAFSPLEGMVSAGASVFTDHRIKASDALKQLVALGPTALPALLAHLDDRTPTRLRIDHDGGIGIMCFANELSGNPLSTLEQSILQTHKRPEADPFGGDHVRSYTVKVGDICLVAIGQVTGRGYQAVRYQPTACVVLESPTHDAELCAQVRAMWHSDDPRQRLFESLLFDYATRGKYDGHSFDGWYVGSDLQVEAATRLLYYFPTESAPLIADRIDHLNVSRTGSSNAAPATDAEFAAWVKREVANEVRTDRFIATTVWSKSPEIVAAMKRVAERTDDEDIIDLVKKTR